MRHSRSLSKVIAVLTAISLTPLRADNTAQALPFSQNWSNAALITADDNWSGVPGITGYRGDDITSSTGVDPQTLLGEGTVTVDVIANQTSTAITNGGVAEFDTLADRVVALQGSGTADAPYLLLNVVTTGQSNIRVQYNLRDIDGTADNAIQPVALQYRVGSTGNFTNIPAGFVADATTGPSLATLVTPVSAVLPAAAENQALVQIRIMTTNAVGNDEWVGIDDIVVSSGLLLTPTTVPNGTVGTPYSQLLTIQNNNGQNCTFGSTGALPDGIALTGATATTITLSGTPTAGGPFSFHMTANCGSAGTLDQVFSITITGGTPTIISIHQVQGSGLSSPLAGTGVTVEGIVVGDFQGANGLQGFFVQEEDADADSDPNTSEGIFVFDGSLPTVNVSLGDKVQVSGTVSEFNSSGVLLTELGSPTVTVVSSANALPTITTLTFPAASATDFERFESMRAQITQAMTVTDTFTHGSFGELALSANGRRFQPTHLVAPGAGAVTLQNTNDLFRIVLDDGSGISRENFVTWLYPESGGLSANNTARVGETIDQTITGILDNRFGTYRIQPTVTPINFHTTLQNPRTAAPAPVGTRIRVGAANVLNFFTTLDVPPNKCGPSNLDCRGANTAAEFTRQRDKIIAALNTLDAHVIGITELENNPTASLQSIIDGLNAINPGKWDFINTGVVGTDAIKPGFIYQPAVVTPIGSPAVLTNAVDIKTIDTRNRPAIAQTFRPVNGNRTDLQYFTVAVNHFKSKGSACGTVNNPGEIADPTLNDGQAECNLTRTSIATALINWLATNPTHEPTPAADRKVLIVGDLNSYAMEDPITAMTSTTFTKPPVAPVPNPNATYTNVMKAFFGNEAYSYVFDGQTGYLDYGLSNKKLTPQVTGAAEWHINADEPIAIDYNVEWIGTTLKTPAQQASLYAPNAYRASDHDPLLVGINPLCGDLDDDGDVDLVDNTLMRAQIGQTASSTNRRMNFDGDSTISLTDYTQWAACYRAYITPAQQQ